jgi:hypothetical protein
VFIVEKSCEKREQSVWEKMAFLNVRRQVALIVTTVLFGVTGSANIAVISGHFFCDSLVISTVVYWNLLLILWYFQGRIFELLGYIFIYSQCHN